MTNPITRTDAMGFPIAIGDTVGGITGYPHDTTVWGPVLKLGRGMVKIQVKGGVNLGTPRAQFDDIIWISNHRVFFVAPAEAEDEVAARQAQASSRKAALATTVKIPQPQRPLQHWGPQA